MISYLQKKIGLTQLRATLWSQLTSLRKAETSRRKTRERAKKRAAFTANCLRDTFIFPNREDALGDCDRKEPVYAPGKQLDVSEPTFGEVKDVVKKTRIDSAPGLNDISLKVYKMYPLLFRRL